MNRAPLLYYIKLCVSYQNHRWVETWDAVRKLSIPFRFGDVLSRVTLKFDEWPWKLIRYLFYTMSNPSANSNWIYSPETINSGQVDDFVSRVTLKFDEWPCKIIGHLFHPTSSFVHYLIIISEIKLEWQPENLQFGSKLIIFVPCDLENWRMTLKNNRAPLLCYIQLWHHCVAIIEFKLELQSGNAQFGSKSTFFSTVWPWNLMDDIKTIRHLSYDIQSFVHHFITICQFRLELQSGNF